MGIAVCYFAEDIIAVTVLWGVVFGFGFGFGTSLLPVVMNLAFDDQNKTKGNGIAFAGSSLGCILMPPIIQASLKHYGLSGSFLIMSALVMHSIPASLLLKVPNAKRTVSTTHESEENTKADFGNKDDKRDLDTGKRTSPQNAKLNHVAQKELLHAPSKLDTNSYMSGYINLSFTISEENNSTKEHFKGFTVTHNEPAGEEDYISNKNLSNVILRGVPKSTESPRVPKSVAILNEKGRFNPEIPSPATRPFSMFLNPTFLLIMLTQSLYGFVVLNVWTIIVDVTRDKGVDRSYEIYCMMLLPLSDMIGRLGLGWITDGGYMSQTNFCVVSFLCLGLFSLLFPWMYGLELMLLAIFLFSFVSGGLMAVFPGVVHEFVADHYKTMAITSRSILMAPLSLTVSPLIGFFRERCGSYDGIFYLMFAISILCCAMAALIPRCSREEHSNHEKTEKT